MIILEKKKILYALGIIMLFIFTYMITGYNVGNNKNNIEIDAQTIQTVALPVNNKIIILDAGHGIPDEGAQSSTRNNRGRK